MTNDDLAHQALIRDIGRRLPLASPDEVRVLDRVLQRLELGRDRYGALDLSRPREWRRELREELLDALVYDVCEELAVEDIDRAQLRADAAVEQEQLRVAMVDTPEARAAIREYHEREVKRLGAAPILLDDAELTGEGGTR
jgi:hypothetical protein